jgi:hypothetical protein
MAGNVRDPESRDPESPARVPPHRADQTTPQKDERRVEQTPHERDESSASQQGAPNELMKKARDDVERGLVDTSKGEATDATYRRELRPEPQRPERSDAVHPADGSTPSTRNADPPDPPRGTSR